MFGADFRLKDDRGNHRDRDNRTNIGERFDRLENIPPSDGLDGADVGNLDDPMYDAFGGQGLRVAPHFPSDIAAPPVLMPVPGAGYAPLFCPSLLAACCI